jgi:hypothetical protein
MRTIKIPVAVTMIASLVACVGASSDDADAEGALESRSTFVLASAGAPTCVASAPFDVPLDVKDGAFAVELQIDVATSTIRLASNPNYCLDVQFEQKSVGASVMFHVCHGHANQSWRLSKALDEKSFLEPAVRIEAFANDRPSNLCLGAQTASSYSKAVRPRTGAAG